MKLYETTIIFDPGLEEARVNEETERVTQPIAQAGGEVIEVQRWGKRKLAYMIGKRRDGTYVHVKHKSPPTLVAEMDRRFRLNESVLRHLTVIAPKESPKEEPKTGEEGEKAAAATPAVGE
ncbi:MAG TPA: 30S ribosomal protein S6 [Candidatus Eisenbacteria bacterium]|jgi:small subunit ribosomal protein S6|nr:30S ribosomal protein S6 [Candidatus Eisenbacteria bacterium]